ncbi:hypothetical protein CANARDRAFT_67516 [[Candida] arabinofermentans NRRL YB-2248]|uniref:Uncharacterized protein n=1 Tax=[Candida] arabinofermentans NRRL YB-2248 TaxID=983967 RepID=A0A1E4SY49_9ASCO|nr:hypothetical protein CANARDRAFT_67516 [[Candida] arabinofermentans NRRL YB-2248]
MFYLRRHLLLLPIFFFLLSYILLERYMVHLEEFQKPILYKLDAFQLIVVLDNPSAPFQKRSLIQYKIPNSFNLFLM